MPVILSTGDLRYNYEVVDVIFAMDSHQQGFIRNADPNRAFAGVKIQLQQQCIARQGHAVINCQFEYRVAFADGSNSKKQVFEIFAYGTVVRFI